MPRRLLRILPPGPRRFVDRNLHTIGYLILFAAMFGSLYVSWHAGRAADDKIQDSRVEVALDSCRAQNDRHDDTIRKLDGIIASLPPGRQRERAQASRANTVLLIDALAPKRDCRALVRKIRSVDD